MTPLPELRRSATDHAAPAGAAGFALIELLVALTVLGLLSLALFGGLRFGARAWEAGDVQSEWLAELETSQSLLRRQLARAVYTKEKGDDPELEAFRGEPDIVRFVAPFAAQAGATGGFYRFEIFAADDGEGRGLYFRWAVYRPSEPPRYEAENSRRLVGDIEALRIRYFGDPDDQGDPRWRDRWEDAVVLPEVVSIDLEFAGSDRRRWPELRVALPGLETPAGF